MQAEPIHREVAMSNYGALDLPDNIKEHPNAFYEDPQKKEWEPNQNDESEIEESARGNCESCRPK